MSDETTKIIPGITLDSMGHVTVDPRLTEILIDVAIEIDDASKFPIDVEHVLGAIVLASQSEAIDASTELSLEDKNMIAVLAQHVETIFEKFDGRLGADD